MDYNEQSRHAWRRPGTWYCPGCKKGLQRHIEYVWGHLVVVSGAYGA